MRTIHNGESQETLIIDFALFVLYIEMPFILELSLRDADIMDSNAIGNSRRNRSIRNDYPMQKPDQYCQLMSLGYIRMPLPIYFKRS
jgi:hypothetical protein